MTDQPRKPEPGPNQAGINRRQGQVNELQGDVNEAVSDELSRRQDVAGERADISEAKAEEATVRRDADDANRTAEFDAQAVTNAAAVDSDAQRTAEFDRQAQTNADQNIINKTAIEALREVGRAAKRVTDLLEASADRAKRWTRALAVVVLIVAVLGGVGYWKLKMVTDDAAQQRNHLATQTRTACHAAGVRTAAVKAELTFLVDYAIGSHNKSSVLRKFRAGYPAHLAKTIPPVRCAP